MDFTKLFRKKNHFFCLKLQFLKLLDPLFTVFVGQTFIWKIYMCFFIVLEYKQIFKKFKTLIFMENWPKIAFFRPKMSQRPQGPHWDPQDHEKYFFELPGYENHMLEKRIFELSPIEKKLVWPYQAKTAQNLKIRLIHRKTARTRCPQQ